MILIVQIDFDVSVAIDIAKVHFRADDARFTN